MFMNALTIIMVEWKDNVSAVVTTIWIQETFLNSHVYFFCPYLHLIA